MNHQRRAGIGARITSFGVYSLSGMVAGLLVVAGCSDTSGAPQVQPSVDGGADSAGDTAGPDGGALTCRPAPQASENLNPRVDVTAPAMQGQRVIKTSDLFTRFNSICGGCHVAAANGGFQVTAATFPTVFDASRLARIESNDPTFAMPPVGKAFSSRGPDDPVVQLAKLLEVWLAQGRPVDVFVADSSSVPSDMATASYAYSALTNLGNCVPPPAMYASSASTEMTAKDTFFANATSLPDDLADTDLTTFDTAALSANGVIAYRPTYPLWSDGSGKLRFIRVPKGTSIKFDKEKQTFDIPPNTRFYKTFFREIVDKAGQVSHRKMETRVIVTRADIVDSDGTTPLPQALYGTYLWSDDEMTATLWKNPNRDGTGFSDLTEEYVTNEIVYQDVIDNLGPGAASLAVKLKNELSDPKHLGLVQHYAVPGSIRCVQCHRGSPTQDFVLGFYPRQVAQRAAGTGGTYEPVDADELNQLQRFIDYGLITGMASPADVVPLEASQAPRMARTPEELNAQAYMIGNCAHCHNPRGYPSLAKPELATALNFLPGSADNAGIFQFGFEQMSSVRSRGANQDVPIPYITPSLRDYPVADETLVRVDNGVQLQPPDPHSSTASEVTWSPKYDYEVEGPGGLGCASNSRDPNLEAFCRGRTTGHTFVPAPWRSLIYRNVDTPFPYFDDYVPFPHMPMNTAGFDCRAPRIMGSWMVGLPAVLKPKYRNLLEDTIPYARNSNGTYPPYYIDAPQPYQEVKPGDDGYADAVAAAKERLAEYQNGIRYQYCQDVLSTDILDPTPPTNLQFGAPHDDNTFYPIADRYLFGGVPPFDPSHPGQYVQPAIGVPYHAEWFDYDPTDVSPWHPRRADWTSVIVDGKPDTATQVGLGADTTGAKAAALADSRRRLTDALQKAQLTDDLRRYATTEVPYGLWQAKPGCETKLAAITKTLSDPAFTGVNRPAWMDKVQASLKPPSPDTPVYMMSPGAALYRHICINCHGPKADGKGLQSDALAASSEGKTRPANLSGGLFGPLDSLGSNLLATFGQNTGDRAVADKWASHYMAWMTLGGTLQLIPQDIINQVEATTIFGAKRQNLSDLGLAETVSANMLNLAKGLCAVVLPDVAADTALTPNLQPDQFSSAFAFPSATAFAPLNFAEAPFLRTNGDWDMWMNLCSRFNRQLVRVFVAQDGPDLANHEIIAPLRAIYYADDGNNPPSYQYPADPSGHYGVWDQKQQSHYEGVTPDNYYPTCLARGPIRSGAAVPDPALVDALQARLKMPYCDPAFLQHQELIMWSATDSGDAAAAEVDNMREWALHGAINAAMSVFSYLEMADLAPNKLPPYYNQCELLP